MTIELTEKESEFVERMGVMAQADNLPRIAGRMWGLFMVVGDILSFSEVAEALQISRGSVSTNARILENLGVLERRSVPGERQDYFAVRNDPYITLLEITLKRQQEKARIVQQAKSAIRRKTARARFDELEHFYEALARGFQSSIDELHKAQRRK